MKKHGESNLKFHMTNFFLQASLVGLPCNDTIEIIQFDIHQTLIKTHAVFLSPDCGNAPLDSWQVTEADFAWI